MLISELLEDLPNDAERIIYLTKIKKQVEDLERSLKNKLIETPLTHSQIKYIERKNWIPAPAVVKEINSIDSMKKKLIEKSKKDKMGEYKITTYIQISTPKVDEKPLETKSEPADFNSFFGVG